MILEKCKFTYLWNNYKTKSDLYIRYDVKNLFFYSIQMHFIRRCIINADALDIEIERCRWKSRRVTYRSSVPFPSSLLPLSFSRGASKQASKREANTPILINSRGISIYSSEKH